MIFQQGKIQDGDVQRVFPRARGVIRKHRWSMCTNQEEEITQPQVKKRKRIQKEKVDVSTQTNEMEDDDEIFPTMEEMLHPNVLAFGKVPVKEPYQIMKVEAKKETFKDVTSENLHMTLRKKGEQNTQVVRCSVTIAKH